MVNVNETRLQSYSPGRLKSSSNKGNLTFWIVKKMSDNDSIRLEGGTILLPKSKVYILGSGIFG